ncbi:MAG: AbrB/MazE/SpoVT family DNA-binding domain-containing protein, partial [Deltaproteobacteria bacterium]|nr:AbrB/MazE/SpoVT family DNA-binding domain-containing protein [Deltaproteobacteria bacterium]
MNQARALDGGKLTLPLEIQEKLGVKDGDRVTFIQDADGVRIVNAALLAIETIQQEMAGEAERSGLDTDEKIVA